MADCAGQSSAVACGARGAWQFDGHNEINIFNGNSD